MHYEVIIKLVVNGNIDAATMLAEFTHKISFEPIYENLGEHEAPDNIPGTGTMSIKEVGND